MITRSFVQVIKINNGKFDIKVEIFSFNMSIIFWMISNLFSPRHHQIPPNNTKYVKWPYFFRFSRCRKHVVVNSFNICEITWIFFCQEGEQKGAKEPSRPMMCYVFINRLTRKNIVENKFVFRGHFLISGAK